MPLLLIAVLAPGCARPVAPDLVITNAQVFTNDAARPWAEALAIRRDRVVAVGDSPTLRASAGPSTRIIDAGGRVVVPGFNDARVDLPLETPTPAALSALDRSAIARGVTSLQVVAGGPMRALVEAARQATRQARWRLIRSPEDGDRSRDEEPFLPPQPGVRLVANGVSWTLGLDERRRTAVARERLPTIVGWAYGAEDPLVMSGLAGAAPWLEALGHEGVPQVWQRKRPRFDAFARVYRRDLDLLVRLGVVVVVVVIPPSLDVDVSREASPGAMLDAGIAVAVGSSGSTNLMEIMASALVAGPPDAGRPLTREEAVRAMTWGSAYAEKGERDKGWLRPGTLADIAVLSGDAFTVPDANLAGITSVLTVVGGAIVYDAGVLSK